MSPQGFNAGINLGRVAGAGVEDHIHLHVVPRWSGDTNFMPVLADVKVMPEHVTRAAEKLRAAWPRRNRGQSPAIRRDKVVTGFDRGLTPVGVSRPCGRTAGGRARRRR